jgi:hypothetical protein
MEATDLPLVANEILVAPAGHRPHKGGHSQHEPRKVRWPGVARW